MLGLLDHPDVQSLVLPGVVSVVLIAALRRSPLAAALAATVLAVAALGWLAAPQLRDRGAALLAGLAALLVGSAVVMAHLAWRETPATRPVSILGVAAAGLAGVAFPAGSGAIAQLAAALGVAAGVYGLYALIVPRARFAAGGTLGGGGALVVHAVDRLQEDWQD